MIMLHILCGKQWRVGCDVMSVDGDVYKHDKHKWTSNKHKRLAQRRVEEL